MAMKIIAPMNNKGGIGKTKVSILLTEYFSVVKKKRVLAIDFDPQCNFSRRFLEMEVDPNSPQGYVPPIHPDYDSANPDEDPTWDGRSSIANIFFGQAVVPYPTYIENLDIAPANADHLLLVEAQTRSELVEKVHGRMAAFLNSAEVESEYDLVIIDTAPSKGPLTVSAIKAASHIIIPCVMETQPIQGIFGMMQLWMQETMNRERNRPLELIGILPNMYRANNLHKDMLESLQENPAIAKHIMPVKLSQRVAFAETDAEGAVPRSIFDLPDSNPAKMEALAMCQLVEKKVYGDE
jgi:chromosome partitioning protein